MRDRRRLVARSNPPGLTRARFVLGKAVGIGGCGQVGCLEKIYLCPVRASGFAEHTHMPEHDIASAGETRPAMSAQEVSENIRNLGAGEKAGLAKIARLYSRKTPYDPADLLQESICRALSGERTWPKGISALLFLGGVIQSVAWQWRQRDLWSDLDAVADPATKPAQEWVLFLDEFVASFSDDTIAQSVLVAVMMGQKGKELLAVIEPALNGLRSSEGQPFAATEDLERELERILKKIRRRSERYQRESVT